MNSQENRLAPANPGSFVNRKNIPKISIKAESKIPNISLFISQFLQLRNHLVVAHCFVFELFKTSCFTTCCIFGGISGFAMVMVFPSFSNSKISSSVYWLYLS